MKFVLLLALLPAFYGQSAMATEQRPLAAVKSWKCEFPLVATSDWQKDEPSPEIKKQTFSFHIDNVNIKAQTARMIGNAGSEDVVVLFGSDVLHILESTPTGILNVTTVFAAISKSRKFKSVHSRHVILVGDPLPSQAYGYCQPWQ